MWKSIELHKVVIEIERHGSNYLIQRNELNEYREKTGNIIDVKKIQGIFHIEKGYSTRTVSDGSETVSKGQSKLFVKTKDICSVIKNDFLEIDNKAYIITDINDIEGFGIVSDLSLEVLQDGNKS
mgnify:CR=1 FL=1